MKNVLLGIIILLFLSVDVSEAKSFYAITDHGYRDESPNNAPAKIAAFDIQDDEIDLQYIYEMNQTSYPTGGGLGPVGIAIDSTGSWLFVTHENMDGNYIKGVQLINAKSLDDFGVVDAPGASDLAGIVFDENRNKVYTVDRGTTRLFVYSWHLPTHTLTLDGQHTLTVEPVDDPLFACGLAYDSVEDILYVTSIGEGGGAPGHGDISPIVHTYDVNDWSHLGSIVIQVGETEYNAVGVAVYNDDAGTNYLYIGAYSFDGTHTFLVRTDLDLYPTDPNSAVLAKNLGTGTSAIGIAVDPTTGLVYTTRSNNSVAVYDTSNWSSVNEETIAPTDSETGSYINGPAGICVPAEDIGYKPKHIDITKVDDITGCVDPEVNNEIVYTITIDPNDYDHTDVTVRDILPYGVSFVSADPNFDYIDFWVIGDAALVWELGELDSEDPPFVITLTVEVNELAEPLSEIINTATVESDIAYNWATETTSVCCWGGDIIYVDDSAMGANTGTSWQDAYVDLQSALARAQAGCGDKIWVAQGIYVPGDAAGDAFNLITGVAVYGGFRGEETLLSQRDPVHYKSILSGNDACDNVVKADDVDNTAIFDGFTVCAAAQDGIACTDGAEAMITACIVEANGDSGIYISAGSPTIDQCLIRDNGGDGVELYASAAPVITHCLIDHNQGHGVNGGSAIPTIGNCYIKNSGLDGISIANPSTAPMVYNNTITLNTGMAIYQSGGTAANASNCILWANNSDAGQYTGCGLTYSCYYDPNNAPSNTPDGNHNITVDPLFAYDDPNHCHIHNTSPCKDRGTNYTGSLTDTDIDGDDRVINSIIDMGCDEVACSDIEHAWDFNQDSIINLLEFAPFVAAWLKDDSDQDWATHARCDFDTDEDVDLDDLCLFSEVWLWQACWRNADSYFAMMMRGGGGENLLMSSPVALSATELEAAKLARWRELQPAFEPTGQTLLWQIEDIIDWLEKLWATDPDFRKDITEEDFLSFVKKLYESKSELEVQLEKQNELQ